MNSVGTIVYIGGFELPDKNASAHRVMSNSKILAKLGYKIVLIGITHDEIEEVQHIPQSSTTLLYEEYKIKYPTNFCEWFYYLTEIKHISNILLKYEDLKAVFCYNLSSIQLMKIKRMSLKNNFKVVSDITEWYGAQGENPIKKMIKGIDSFFRMRVLNKKMDGVIVISNYLLNYYVKKIGNDKIIKIPPLVDMSETKWKKSTNLIGGQLKFVYAGSPGKHKDNLHQIINTLVEIRNEIGIEFIFNILGITSEDYLKIYPKDAKLISKNQTIIRFLGKKSHIESLNILKYSNFSILIRDVNKVNNAGFPTKVVESISSKVPVIANITSDIDEYVNHGINGYLLTKDYKSDLMHFFNNYEKLSIVFDTNIDNSLFDYHNYINIFQSFMDSIMSDE